MQRLAAELLAHLGCSDDELRVCDWRGEGDSHLHTASVHHAGNAFVALGRDDCERFLLAVAPDAASLPEGFSGETFAVDGGAALRGAWDEGNAAALRRHFPWTAPVSLRDRRTTVGCGDRLGRATPGHIAAARADGAAPVLAQQSLRELARTGRTFRNVVDDACFAVYQCDYRDGYGADGDHLKTLADIDAALAAGMPMITLDLSDVMNAAAADWTATEVDAAFALLPADARARAADCDGKTFTLDGGEVAFGPGEAARCAVMYTDALDFARVVFLHLTAKRGEAFDLEISIDETTAPTLPAHHLFIARELAARGVAFSSLAPRFIGEFQKAVDYIGDVDEFDRQFRVHAAIARAHGAYKISVHSGSDKFAVYPSIGRWTEGRLHLKTAGTSWLVAATIVARTDPDLYRFMHAQALDRFADMQKLYHITADPKKIPDLAKVGDCELPTLMELPEARQVMHIAYGPILTGPLRERFFRRMFMEEDAYTEAIRVHFDKHLRLLGLEPRA